MTFQTAKSDAPTLGSLGRVVDFEAGAHEIANATAKTAIGLGLAVSYDAEGKLVVGGAKFVGISADQSYINNPGVDGEGKPNVKAGGELPFLRKGTIAVLAPANVTPTSPVGYVTATGVLTIATGATITTIAGATWEAVASSGALVPLRLNS